MCKGTRKMLEREDMCTMCESITDLRISFSTSPKIGQKKDSSQQRVERQWGSTTNKSGWKLVRSSTES